MGERRLRQNGLGQVRAIAENGLQKAPPGAFGGVLVQVTANSLGEGPDFRVSGTFRGVDPELHSTGGAVGIGRRWQVLLLGYEAEMVHIPVLWPAAHCVMVHRWSRQRRL